MALLGNHALETSIAISMTSYIEACGRIGISEQATRSTLARMRTRGLLRSERRGRRAYLGLTESGAAVMRDGQRRLEEPLAQPWDGHWTLVAVALPTGKEAARHQLRSRLIWAGFGGLSNGLWAAPRQVDIGRITGGLGLDEHIRTFSADTLAPTTPEQLIAEGYDLAQISARHDAFLQRWSRPEDSAADPLSRHLLLYTDWLLAIREDPRLPIEFLPKAWPGFRAEARFRELAHALAASAADEARELLDVITTAPARSGRAHAQPPPVPVGSHP